MVSVREGLVQSPTISISFIRRFDEVQNNITKIVLLKTVKRGLLPLSCLDFLMISFNTDRLIKNLQA